MGTACTWFPLFFRLNCPDFLRIRHVEVERVITRERHRHIPDPDLLRHPHIAVPLADLTPEYRHPETGQTLAEIAEEMPSTGLVRRADFDLGMSAHDAVQIGA